MIIFTDFFGRFNMDLIIQAEFVPHFSQGRGHVVWPCTEAPLRMVKALMLCVGPI